MIGKLIDLSFSRNRKQRITVEVNRDFREEFDRLKDVDVDIEIKKHYKSRSKNANSYMWCLCDELGKVLGITKEEVYKEQIRKVGVFRAVALDKSVAGTIFTAWRRIGTGWVVEELYEESDKVHALLYYGSSTYNTAQMSRLIDSLVEDCKEYGIETMTPNEIEKMKSLWKCEVI